MFRKQHLVVVSGIAAAALMGAGVSLAATGSAAKSSTIHGCENTKTHALSILSGKSCKKGYKALSWNVTGPQGPAGSQGAKGATGATGSQGPAGANGTNGTNGTDGLAGAVYRYNNYPDGIGPGGIATVECGDTDSASEQYVAVSGGVEVGNGTGFPTTNDLASTSQSLPVAASFPGVMDWNTNSPDPGRLDGWIIQTEVGYDANDTAATVWALCVPVADSGQSSIPVQQDNNSNG
jgi:hypothetical protein